MAATSLRREGDYWDIFRGWELEVYRNTKPNIPVIALFTGLRQEWRKIIGKVSYAKALHKLQESNKDLVIDSTRVRFRKVTFDNIKARVPTWRQQRDSLRSYERLVESLDKYIERLKDHVRCLRAVQREQTAPNLAGKPAGNERSRNYTTKLMNDTKSRLDHVNTQIAECKSWLRGSSPLPSSDRDAVSSEPQDEDDGGRRENEKGQNESGAAYDANGAGGRERVDVSATGGAAGGAGAGDGFGGSGDDDGEDKRRPPASKPNVGNVDEDNDNDKEDKDSGSDIHTPGSKTDNRRKPAERAGASLEAGHDGDMTLLDDFEKAVQQHAEQQEHQARPPRSQSPSLPDYSAYAAAEAQAAVPPGSSVRTQQLSQQPGASRNDSGESGSNGQGSHVRENDDRQGTEDHGDPIAAAGGPDDPGDGSDKSDDDQGPSKDLAEGSGRGIPRSKNKRSSDDGDSPGQDRSKRQKQANDQKFRADKGIDNLSYDARKYLDDATKPDVPIILKDEILNKFVKRLNNAFGEDFERLACPIESYFNEDGTEKAGDAWQDLKRYEFEAAWNQVLSNISLRERASYQAQYNRLITAEAWDIIPETGFGQQPHDLNQLRHWAVEAEYPEEHKAWKLHEAHMRERGGSDAAEEVHRDWQEMVERIIAYGGYPHSPDQTPTLGPTDGPLFGSLADDTNLLRKKARKLGFEEGESIWSFLATLGTGGYGHAGLWARYDSSAKIIERRVVKETYLNYSTWEDEHFWMDPTGAREVPREFWLGVKLANRNQSFNVLGPCYFKVHSLQKMYRLYMSFCPHGDLGGLIDEHIDVESSGHHDQEDRKLRSPIPVSAAWCVFEALASAACLMKNGHLPGDNEDSDWDTIYHRDIKPYNIFLDVPDENFWKHIPVPRLADFGCSMEHSPKNVEPPSNNSMDVGTPRWRAPECEVYDPGLNIAKHPYTSAGDIFSVGQTMWSLMSRKTPNLYRFDYDIGPRALPESAVAFYPQRMQTLMTECLRSKPNERIAAERLWKGIQDEVATCKSLRDPPLRMSGLVEGETLQLKPDKYNSWAV